jgi:hypothetical protein
VAHALGGGEPEVGRVDQKLAHVRRREPLGQVDLLAVGVVRHILEAFVEGAAVLEAANVAEAGLVLVLRHGRLRHKWLRRRHCAHHQAILESLGVGEPVGARMVVKVVGQALGRLAGDVLLADVAVAFEI